VFKAPRIFDKQGHYQREAWLHLLQDDLALALWLLDLLTSWIFGIRKLESVGYTALFAWS